MVQRVHDLRETASPTPRLFQRNAVFETLGLTVPYPTLLARSGSYWAAGGGVVNNYITVHRKVISITIPLSSSESQIFSNKQNLFPNF